MTKLYRIQGERFSSRHVGYRCLYLHLSIAQLADAARHLLYARHRRDRKLHQVEHHVDGWTHDPDGQEVRIDRYVLNIDERSRLFFTTRSLAYDVETIKFNYEELAFPWVIGMASHTICVSKSFFHKFGTAAEQMYPRSKYVLWNHYEQAKDKQGDVPPL